MCARDINPRDAHDRRNVVTGRADAASSPIAPVPAIGIPPSTVTEMDNVPAMRTLAMFAAPLGTAEPDQPRQLGPVDRVEPAMFGHDRHDDSMSQPSRERKQKIERRAEGLHRCRATDEGPRPSQVHHARMTIAARCIATARLLPILPRIATPIDRRAEIRTASWGADRRHDRRGGEHQGRCPFVPERQSIARVIRRAWHPTRSAGHARAARPRQR